jgi:peptidoglycan/LPS O-acetylase OafA/YrhL
MAVLLFTTLHPGQSGPVTALAFALVGSLAVIPLAWLTYIGVERPGRQLIRRWAETVGRHGMMA